MNRNETSAPSQVKGPPPDTPRNAYLSYVVRLLGYALTPSVGFAFVAGMRVSSPWICLLVVSSCYFILIIGFLAGYLIGGLKEDKRRKLVRAVEDEYWQSSRRKAPMVSERIKHSRVVQDLLRPIRSAYSYMGCNTLRAIEKTTGKDCALDHVECQNRREKGGESSRFEVTKQFMSVTARKGCLPPVVTVLGYALTISMSLVFAVELGMLPETSWGTLSVLFCCQAIFFTGIFAGYLRRRRDGEQEC